LESHSTTALATFLMHSAYRPQSHPSLTIPSYDFHRICNGTAKFADLLNFNRSDDDELSG
jgi:hypothetical protein